MSFLCGEANARSEGTCKTLEIRRPSSLISVRSSCAADPATTVSLTDYQQGRIQNGAAPRAELLIHVQNSLILLPRPPFV